MTKGEWMTPEEYIAKLEEENEELKECAEENSYLRAENRKLREELELKNLALKQAQEWSILI